MKKVLSLILVVAMMLSTMSTSIQAGIAIVGNSVGSGGIGTWKDAATILTIEKVELTEKIPESAKTDPKYMNNGEYVGDLGYTYIKNILGGEHPEYNINPANSLILTRTNYEGFNDKGDGLFRNEDSFKVVLGDNVEEDFPKGNVRATDVVGAAPNLDTWRGYYFDMLNALDNDGPIKDTKIGEIVARESDDFLASPKYKEFLAICDDPALLAELTTKCFEWGGTDAKSYLGYLDVMLMLNAISRDKWSGMVLAYVKNQYNAEGQSYYIFIKATSASYLSIDDGAERCWYYFTLPSFWSTAFKTPVKDILNEFKGSTPYTDTGNAINPYHKEVVNKMPSILLADQTSLRGIATDSIFGTWCLYNNKVPRRSGVSSLNTYNFGYTYVMSDKNGVANGYAGTAYFSDFVQRYPDTFPDLEVGISAKEEFVQVIKGNGATNEVTISIDSKDKTTIDNLYKNGYKVQLVVRVKKSNGSVSDSSSKVMDTHLPIADSVKDVSPEEVILTYKDLTMDKLNSLITSGVTFLDSGLVVDTLSDITYDVTAVLDAKAPTELKSQFPELKSVEQIVAKGVGPTVRVSEETVSYTRIDNTPTSVKSKNAYCTVQYLFDAALANTNTDPLEDESFNYTTSFVSPLAEFKNGTAGSFTEKFEAMAGVPTTEEMYIGVGAQPYYVSMNAEETKVTGHTRTYTFVVNTTAHESIPCVPATCGQSASDNAGIICGLSEHSHSSSCYDEFGSLTCSTPVHSHVTSCYQPHDVTAGPCGVNHSCPANANNKHSNEHHTTAITYTYKVTVPFDDFSYMDMKDFDLRVVDTINASNMNQDVSDDLGIFSRPIGYKIFKGITNGSQRRVLYSASASSSDYNGNTTVRVTVPGTQTSASSADAEITKTLNTAIAKFNDSVATVISDSVAIKLPTGYQDIYSNSFKSNKYSLTAHPGVHGSSPKSYIEGHQYLSGSFTEPKVGWEAGSDKLIDTQDPNTYDFKDVGIIGYNGNYSSPSSKWTAFSNPSIPITSADFISRLYSGSGNCYNPSDWTTSDYSISGDGETYLSVSGLEFSRVGKESSVVNGFKEMGNLYVTYKGVKVGSPPPTPVSAAELAVYSGKHSSINDIVVHDPISAERAIVLSNSSEYDRRTEASLSDSSMDESDLLPNVSSEPVYQLKDIPREHEHDASCYTTVTETIHDHSQDVAAAEPSTAQDLEWMQAQAQKISGLKHDNGSFIYQFRRYGMTNRSIIMSNDPDSFYGDIVEAGYHLGAQYGTGYYYTNSRSQYGSFDVVANRYRNMDFILFTTKNYNVAEQNFYIPIKGGMYSISFILNSSNHLMYVGLLHSSVSTLPSSVYGSDEPIVTTPVHVCNENCITTTREILDCDDPHHFGNYYPYGDPRDWELVPESSKTTTSDVDPVTGKAYTVIDGVTYPLSDLFINTDKEFTIRFPKVGDFAQVPSMHGIGEISSERGMGYTNDMDLTDWTLHRLVKFPYAVVHSGVAYDAGTWINLNDISETAVEFTFYCPLANDEMSNAKVVFKAVADNAPNGVDTNDSIEMSNTRRGLNVNAMHSASRNYYVDVVGYFGSLTLYDTGDFRFANFFKQTNPLKKPIISGLVPNVDYTKVRSVSTDPLNVRYESVASSPVFADTYSTNIGGRNSSEINFLPLSPDDNNLKALQNQPMRAGYKAYFDVETVGNYYGETALMDDSLSAADSLVGYTSNNMVAKMSVRPYYWAVNKTTGVSTPIDVYATDGVEYLSVNKFNKDSKISDMDYKEPIYLNLTSEATRRGVSLEEISRTTNVSDVYDVRHPFGVNDLIGTPLEVILNDLDRTFIGSSKTDGDLVMDTSTSSVFKEVNFMRNAQRWQFTVELPSSAVFVKEGDIPNTANIDKIMNDEYAIVCGLDMLVKGDIWTLQYDGSSINGISSSKPNGSITIGNDGSGGKVVVPAPKEKDGTPTNKPIVLVLDSEKTSKDDLQVYGSH